MGAARFGWLQVSSVYKRGNNRLDVCYQTHTQGQGADIRLPEQGVLEAGPLAIMLPTEYNGIILSGKLPRWAFAPSQAWVEVDAPAYQRVIVVASQTTSLHVGSLLSRSISPDYFL